MDHSIDNCSFAPVAEIDAQGDAGLETPARLVARRVGPTRLATLPQPRSGINQPRSRPHYRRSRCQPDRRPSRTRSALCGSPAAMPRRSDCRSAADFSMPARYAAGGGGGGFGGLGGGGLQICNQAKSEVADALSARLRFARANQPDLIMMRKDARYRPPAPKPVCWTYFPFPSGLTTWRAHDEKPGQWTERVFITLLGPWDRGAGGRSESRSRSHALHASLTVIAMHIDGIASFITLPVAAVLVVTLVLLIATVVL